MVACGPCFGSDRHQATTVFAWVWVQILLLPVVISGVVWGTRGGLTRIVVAALVGFLVIDFAPLLVISGVLIPEGFALFWMVPLFLLVYSIFRIQTTRGLTSVHSIKHFLGWHTNQ